MVLDLAHIDQSDGQGSTPLLLACSRGHTNTVLYLLEAGANPNQPGRQFNETPLDVAGKLDDLSTFELLPQNGADPSCIDVDKLKEEDEVTNFAKLKLLKKYSKRNKTSRFGRW